MRSVDDALFQQVLKKHPDFDCCLALKCLALMRLGRETEASALLEKVVFLFCRTFHLSLKFKVLASSPVDEGALNAMTIAFRELQVIEVFSRFYSLLDVRSQARYVGCMKERWQKNQTMKSSSPTFSCPT